MDKPIVIGGIVVAGIAGYLLLRRTEDGGGGKWIDLLPVCPHCGFSPYYEPCSACGYPLPDGGGGDGGDGNGGDGNGGDGNGGDGNGVVPEYINCPKCSKPTMTVVTFGIGSLSGSDKFWACEYVYPSGKPCGAVACNHCGSLYTTMISDTEARCDECGNTWDGRATFDPPKCPGCGIRGENIEWRQWKYAGGSNCERTWNDGLWCNVTWEPRGDDEGNAPDPIWCLYCSSCKAMLPNGLDGKPVYSKEYKYVQSKDRRGNITGYGTYTAYDTILLRADGEKKWYSREARHWMHQRGRNAIKPFADFQG